MRVRSAAAAWMWIALVASAVSCSRVLGFEEPQSEQPCILNSDCEPNKVCIFRACSTQCVQDVDCPGGYRCLKTTNGSACIDAHQAWCELTCPEGTTCAAADHVCRTSCKSTAECLIGQTCNAAETCVGSSSVHDPALDGGPPDAHPDQGGGAGADASFDVKNDTSANGDGTKADTGSNAGDSPQGNPDAPLGDGYVDAGRTCSTLDAVMCPGPAQKKTLRCDGMQWVDGPTCAADKNCDSSSGTCQPIVAACMGMAPGAAVCVGANVHTCGPDLASTTLATTCSGGTPACLGGKCVACNNPPANQLCADRRRLDRAMRAARG